MRGEVFHNSLIQHWITAKNKGMMETRAIDRTGARATRNPRSVYLADCSSRLFILNVTSP